MSICSGDARNKDIFSLPALHQQNVIYFYDTIAEIHSSLESGKVDHSLAEMEASDCHMFWDTFLLIQYTDVEKSIDQIRPTTRMLVHCPS